MGRRLQDNTSRRIKRSSAWYWWPPSRYVIVGLCVCELTELLKRSASIDIIRVTQLVRNGGDKQLSKNRESHSEVCTCGISTQQWPTTRITLFERTRQSATRRWGDTSWQEASEFLYIKTPPFLREFRNKKNPPKNFGNAFSDALLTNVTFSKFRGWRRRETALRADFWNRASRDFNWSINSGPKILRSCLLHWSLGAHHPLSPAIKLGVRGYPRKRDGGSSFSRLQTDKCHEGDPPSSGGGGVLRSAYSSHVTRFAA